MSSINYKKIMELLPHRYPFLFVDSVEEIVLGESATGIKNVTLNEPIFQGHFPKEPIFPGVLIIEAMAQTAAVLAQLTLEAQNQEGSISDSIYLMTVEEAKFRLPVRPGNVMKMRIKKELTRLNVWKFRGATFVFDEQVAEASFMAMIR